MVLAFLGIQRAVWNFLAAAFGAWVLLDMALWSEVGNVGAGDLMDEYDVIIVGGGTAGSVVAGRLAELENVSILLVEAGGEQTKKVKVPWFHLWLPDSPHGHKYLTEPQEGVLRGFGHQRAKLWQGRVIGGTGAINTMIYMRGNVHDFDHWAELGNEGWSYRDCLPYFQKLEDVKNAGLLKEDALGTYGTGGPMVVEEARHRSRLLEAFLEAGRLLGYPVGNDQNRGQVGFAPYSFNIKGGRRWTSAEAYLLPAVQEGRGRQTRPFHVALHSKVRRILFRDPGPGEAASSSTASGVLLSHNHHHHDGGSTVQVVRARREVIVCAGAIGSPHLLLVSGIGPASQLESFQVPVVKDVPGVGKNFQDHVAAYGLTWTTGRLGSAYNPFLYTADPMTYLGWKIWRTGPLAAPIGVEGNAFVATASANDTWPDIQITFVSSQPGFDGGTVYKDFLGISDHLYESYFSYNAFKEGYTLYPILSRPHSRGEITLKSANIEDDPAIDARYLSDQRDVHLLIQGLKIAKAIGDSSAFDRFQAKFFDKPLPPCDDLEVYSDEYWDCWVRHLAITDHHPVGTCKMGNLERDPMAVVDHVDLKVRGMSNLRVVDSSVMPTVPSGNINVPVIMLAEKAADLIKAALGP